MTVSPRSSSVGLMTGPGLRRARRGLVLIYRATRVINFAHGEIGAFGAAVLVLLIATIGLAQLLLVGRLSLPDTAAGASFPLPFNITWRPGNLVIFSRDILVFIVAPLTIGALALFMTKTKFGLMVRASASNPDTARVYGISVKRTSTIVWTIAGAFAAITAIMIAPIQGITPGSIVRSGTAAIGPALLMRALVVSLIARMHSLPWCLGGGLIVGVGEALVRANVDQRNQSIVDLWLFVATVVLVLFWVRGRREEATWSLASRVKPIPARLLRLWYVRHLNKIGMVVLFGGLALLPRFLTQRSQEFLWADILIFAMAALPISMLTGWAGQVSLGQFAFVGLGAGAMAMLTNGLDIPVPFGLFEMSFDLPWGVALILATLLGVDLRAGDRHPRPAHPGAVPRRRHLGVRGGRVELAVPPGRLHRVGVQHHHALHERTRDRPVQLPGPAVLLLPVSDQPVPHDRRHGSVASIRHRPVDDRCP
jgi:branched-subunit amino acid ABC-type transport system permease component